MRLGQGKGLIQTKGLGSTKGFTLVELVTVILILGILVVGVSSFIIFGTRIFVDSTAIDRVLGSSRFVMERLSRELRNAVPSSLRLQSSSQLQCLEFLPISASGSYLSLPLAPDVQTDTATVFAPATAVSAGEQLLVYPLTHADIYGSGSNKRHAIDKVTANGSLLTLQFAAAVNFAEASPAKRFYVAGQPVSYCFSQADGSIRRYSHYGYHAGQPLPDTMGTGALMAEGLSNDMATNPAVRLLPATLVNNAIVQLQPQFAVVGEKFQYQHQVQVINVP
ncbi:prepilin-type N-terminal cleavage/methylation domain-containing protein [Shewanella indica]|uniref:Prepilin-type N-terminal cleavage/methylation domain-containing protein n=1 Tax=Shewanella indica TaxID=768528 RepID=A0ABU4QAT9_9GAMM|nr:MULTISPECIES: prepilin-type N-terminal cleavage/methylation domain-containing protein [Shewanella]MDX6016561.1 prepilin-type N-terminal cleavage/methylation domain-containing protein [Shewanella indica]NDO75063.1 prepilin-type N-terminal cleavage/methylation domain-containing protein [Shewanella sp. SE1]